MTLAKGTVKQCSARDCVYPVVPEKDRCGIHADGRIEEMRRTCPQAGEPTHENCGPERNPHVEYERVTSEPHPDRLDEQEIEVLLQVLAHDLYFLGYEYSEWTWNSPDSLYGMLTYGEIKDNPYTF